MLRCYGRAAAPSWETSQCLAMQQYFRALLEAFQRASERHPPAEGAAEEQAGVPARDWAGWQHAAALVGVQGDAPAFRARQAIKVALAADAKNMGGEDVVWEQLEQRLEDILAGQTALEDLPDTVCMWSKNWALFN